LGLRGWHGAGTGLMAWHGAGMGLRGWFGAGMGLAQGWHGLRGWYGAGMGAATGVRGRRGAGDSPGAGVGARGWHGAEGPGGLRVPGAEPPPRGRGAVPAASSGTKRPLVPHGVTRRVGTACHAARFPAALPGTLGAPRGRTPPGMGHPHPPGPPTPPGGHSPSW